MNTNKMAQELFPVDPSKFIVFFKNNKNMLLNFQNMPAMYCS